MGLVFTVQENNVMKKIIGTAGTMLVLLVPVGANAQEAEVTANAGWVSQYYYRGILQKTSSASAGLDVAVGNLYLGTWGADVGDGAEIDLYGGFGVEIDQLSLSAGGTAYLYTGEFDDPYYEANFGAGVGALSVEFSIGTYDTSPESESYWFLGITAEQNGFYGTFGTFGDEFDGNYAEAGYGFTAGDMDFSISGIFSDKDLSDAVDEDEDPTSELTLVFGVSKTFALN
jgi:uncharacterized protein (TIGR02001 family)